VTESLSQDTDYNGHHACDRTIPNMELTGSKTDTTGAARLIGFL